MLTLNTNAEKDMKVIQKFLNSFIRGPADYSKTLNDFIITCLKLEHKYYECNPYENILPHNLIDDIHIARIAIETVYI